jgi:archaemetzincin
MRLGILSVGQVNPQVLHKLAVALSAVFPEASFSVITEELPLTPKAYNTTRKQYDANFLLVKIKLYADLTKHRFTHVLGVVDADIFVSSLNYVFGEAYTPGNAALISLCRLRPEFYGEPSSSVKFDLRVLTEVVHEVGHMLGLQHCFRSGCVMHFSNSIFDTDRKQNVFCDECYLQMAIAVSNLG